MTIKLQMHGEDLIEVKCSCRCGHDGLGIHGPSFLIDPAKDCWDCGELDSSGDWEHDCTKARLMFCKQCIDTMTREYELRDQREKLFELETVNVRN